MLQPSCCHTKLWFEIRVAEADPEKFCAPERPVKMGVRRRLAEVDGGNPDSRRREEMRLRGCKVEDEEG